MDAQRLITLTVLGLFYMVTEVEAGCKVTASNGYCTSCTAGYYNEQCSSTVNPRPTELLDWPTYGICVGSGAMFIWAWVIVAWAWVTLDDEVWKLEADEEEAAQREAEAQALAARAIANAPPGDDTGDAADMPLHSSTTEPFGAPAEASSPANPQSSTPAGQAEDQRQAPLTTTSSATASLQQQPASQSQPTEATPATTEATQRDTAPAGDTKQSPTTPPPPLARQQSNVQSRSNQGDNVDAAPLETSQGQSTNTSMREDGSVNGSTQDGRPRALSIRRRPLSRPRSRSDVSGPRDETLSRQDSQPASAIATSTTEQDQRNANQSNADVQPTQDTATERQTPIKEATPTKPPRQVAILETREIAVGTEDVFEALSTRGTSKDLIDAQQWIESKRRAIAGDPSPFLDDHPRPLPLLQSHSGEVSSSRPSTARREDTTRGARSLSLSNVRSSADPVAPSRRPLPSDRSLESTTTPKAMQSDPSEGNPASTRSAVPTEQHQPTQPSQTSARHHTPTTRSPSHQRRGSQQPITNAPEDGEALPPLFEAGDVLLRTYRFPLYDVDVGGTVGVIAPGEACVVDLVEVLYDHEGRYSFHYHFVGGNRAVEQRTVELHMTRVSRDGAKHFEFDDPGAAIRASGNTPRY